MNANDWVNIASFVICFIIFVIMDVMIMKYFQSTYEEGKISIGYKVIVLFGMIIIELLVFLLPFDAENGEGEVGCNIFNIKCGGFHLSTVWFIIYCLSFLMVTIVLPFTIFYYESNDSMGYL
ncbi:hypothetical protein WA158_002772 [Blastocystis sp. Blastoise]